VFNDMDVVLQLLYHYHRLLRRNLHGSVCCCCCCCRGAFRGREDGKGRRSICTTDSNSNSNPDSDFQISNPIREILSIHISELPHPTPPSLRTLLPSLPTSTTLPHTPPPPPTHSHPLHQHHTYIHTLYKIEITRDIDMEEIWILQYR